MEKSNNPHTFGLPVYLPYDGSRSLNPDVYTVLGENLSLLFSKKLPFYRKYLWLRCKIEQEGLGREQLMGDPDFAIEPLKTAVSKITIDKKVYNYRIPVLLFYIEYGIIAHTKRPEGSHFKSVAPWHRVADRSDLSKFHSVRQRTLITSN